MPDGFGEHLAGCAGKVRFESRALAGAVMRRRSGRRHRAGQAIPPLQRQNVYKCRHCGGWHIGTRK